MLHANFRVYLLDDGCLPEAFRISGLSFNTADAITVAVSQDIQLPDLAKKRIQQLSNWFNDDDTQAVRICAALLDEGSWHA
ncbi:hypothetical protein D3C80_1837430 [compost metagenome]